MTFTFRTKIRQASRAALLLAVAILLPPCQSSLRVAEATIGALQQEMAEPAPSVPAWARPAAGPAVEPSLTRPAAALDLSGWPDAVPSHPIPPKAQPANAPTSLIGAHAQARSQSPAAPDDGNVRWAYAGPSGPSAWGSLKPQYALCDIGSAQSPIDLASAAPAPLPEIGFQYRASPLTLVNQGYGLSAPQPPGSWITIGGARYDLIEIRLHSPSEHAIAGQFAAMEIHLVHQNIHGQLAKIAVMAQPGPSNPELAKLANHAPEPPLPSEDKIMANPQGLTLDPNRLLPPERRYIRYTGSLTTPPCSEGVAWHVMLQPITIGEDDLKAIQITMPNPNSRPLQALNGRPIAIQ